MEEVDEMGDGYGEMQQMKAAGRVWKRGGMMGDRGVGWGGSAQWEMSRRRTPG